MKNTVSLLFILIITLTAKSQDSMQWKTTMSYFAEHQLKMNTVDPPPGFTVSYNCDSMLFMRRNHGDTIRIYTTGLAWMHSLESFKKLQQDPAFGQTIFPREISSDGRIEVLSYHQTIFVYRHDSLFQIEDTLSKPKEYFTWIVEHTLGKMDEVSYTRKKDSVDKLYAGRHAYAAKLIFAKHMFQGSKTKVRLSKKVNHEGDQILLEKTWKQNNKTCYLIRINNQYEGQKTSYAYAFDEDIRFIWWEECVSGV